MADVAELDSTIDVDGSPPADASSFALARLSATRPLDPTFGTGGRLVVPLPAGGYASAVVEQPDGTVLVAGLAFTAGSTSVRIVLVRLAA
jgi:hypothetical protein